MRPVEYKVYGTHTFHIPEGMYTLQQLEQLLAECKEMKRRHDAHLKLNMGTVPKDKPKKL